MPYTTKELVKTHLGISVFTYDEILDVLVEDADVEINNFLDIDGLGSATKSNEVVYFKDVFVYGGGYYRFKVNNLNVLTITKINGTTYTGVKGVGKDYHITNDRVIFLKDLYNYILDTSFNFFEISYTYGYTALPDDIKLIAKLWVACSFREKYSLGSGYQIEGIKSYSLGDESITFKDDTRNLLNDKTKLEKLLSKYQKVYVLS